MAISFDAGSAATNQSESATSLTINVTVPSGATLLALAFLGAEASGSFTAVWNGSESMTSVITASVSNYHSELFCLFNPTAGSHSIVVSASSAASIMLGAAGAYLGTHTSMESGTATNTSGAATSITVAQTTVADNAWALSAYVGSANQDPSVNSGPAVIRAKTHNPTSDFGQVALCDIGPVSPAASVTFDIAAGATASIAIVAASVAPASVGGGGVRGGFGLMGVGR